MASERRSGFFGVGVLALAALAVLAAVLLLTERRIAGLLAGDLSGDYTTRLYSAPFRLRPGDYMTRGELTGRLHRLRYEAKPKLEAAGDFRESGGGFEVFLREFDHPFVRPSPVKVEIDLEDGRVRRIRGMDSGLTLEEAALEPELIYEITGAKRIRRKRLEEADIPPKILEALVSIEDKRFFQHSGIDLRGIGRAFWRNIRARRLAEGGSTLTQQLARALFLSPRRTFTRKAAEAFCALYLELRFSKEELLRMYLDSVYFGQIGPVNIIGLAEASHHFFNKDSRDLSLAESALIVGLLRSPYHYNPFRNPSEALRRRSVVLQAMKDQGFITAEEEAKARAEPLGVTRSGQEELKPADYFVAYVQRQLELTYEDEALLTRGLVVHTTLDPWMQELASRSVRKAKYQAALVALDPRTGAIRALMGGKDFAESPFDRATSARRQPGSAFKPFVFGTALRNFSSSSKVWTAASLLSDTTRQYPIESRPDWTPRNYDGVYRGKVDIRDAMTHSINAATVDLMNQLGPQRVIEYAQDLGISSPLRPELGLAMGASEVTLLELTAAYCAFANGGSRVEPYAVDAALDASGAPLEFHTPISQSVLSPAEAYLMTSLLRGVVSDGTAKSLRAWGLETIAAGKTGTTNDGVDAWFIGYTPRVVAGVWTGSDLPLALGLSGAGAALPIWADFVKAAAHPDLSSNEGIWRTVRPDPWAAPEGIVTADIDPESGKLARVGCPQRRKEVFLAGTEPTADCDLHAGGVAGWLRRLFRRSPPAGQQPLR